MIIYKARVILIIRLNKWKMYLIHSNIACEKSIWYKTCTIIACEKSNFKQQKIKKSHCKAHTEEPSSEKDYLKVLPYVFTEEHSSIRTYGRTFFRIKEPFVRKKVLLYVLTEEHSFVTTISTQQGIWKNVLPCSKKLFVSYLSYPWFLIPKCGKSPTLKSP